MTARLSPDLPVAAVLQDAVAAARSGATIVTAPPGSGKTMLVPAAVLDDLPPKQKLVLVQPRRLAARAVARRIAHLRGGDVGGEIGYHVRFDAQVGRDTRLIVATTGILLRRLLDDITLDGIGAVVLDEFHERTIEMDLALGLLVRIRQTLRPDLRIIVMSATLVAEPVAQLLSADSELSSTGRGQGEGTPVPADAPSPQPSPEGRESTSNPRQRRCPIIHAEGRRFPVEIRYLRRRGERQPIEDHVAEQLPFALRETTGHVLIFLPGVGEIMRCQRAITPLVERAGHALMPLYGDLSAEAQDQVLDDIGRRKIILATNVAETSLTIDGVTAVIDSGQARQLQVCPATGLPRLELVPISQASADQRAGRAGRTAAGMCWRLWEEASHKARPAADTPEVLRGDLAEPLLQLLAMGELRDFPWLDSPPAEKLEQAFQLLHLLGAIDSDRQITPLGRTLAAIPAHPRLGRLLLAGAQRGVLRETSVAAAMLSERDPFRSAERASGRPRECGQVRSRSDVVERVAALQAFHAQGTNVDLSLRERNSRLAERDAHTGQPGPLELQPGAARNILRSAEQLFRLADFPRAPRAERPDEALMHALLEAFPDRLAKLRSGTQDRALLVGGRGLRIDASSHVRGESLFLAIDINDVGGEARARVVSAVDREWLFDELEPSPSGRSHHLEPSPSGRGQGEGAPVSASSPSPQPSPKGRGSEPKPLLERREELFFNPTRGQVEARQRTYWLDLLLEETPVAISDQAAAANLLAAEARRQLDRILPAADAAAGSFLARVRWLADALPDLNLPRFTDDDLAELLPDICFGLRSLDDVRNADWLSTFQTKVGYDRLTEVDRLAPAQIELTNGNRHTIVYDVGKPPVLAVRIQEMFGIAATPRIAAGRVPLLLHLLGPNHRPQQVTADLASFWQNGYPEVKKELRRRYPKHSWPDDPLTTPATRSGLKRDAK